MYVMMVHVDDTNESAMGVMHKEASTKRHDGWSWLV
jgi:hypothetical protein